MQTTWNKVKDLHSRLRKYTVHETNLTNQLTAKDYVCLLYAVRNISYCIIILYFAD